ncbi:hypothetical protein BDP27DRAFT_1417260 [Rhodocollybia butyracea]|uniref:Uncharacterized protein n=1 Tax=Rhodocollybia butyracea TaxID=206335 RepID=A0A9P5Q3F2_9AGAR|nr:hypothetical protein BDP27DRAFT_1417260 [Rhodocollybia butyracea]
MTSEEVAEVLSTGRVLFIGVVSNLFLSTLFGIYSLAYFISLYIYFNAENAKKALICVLSGNFVLMLILFVSSVVPLLVLVKHGLVVALPGGIMEQITAAYLQTHLTAWNSTDVLLSSVIPFIIADTVIVWRAWAVWMNNTKVKWTLLLLMLGDIGEIDS